MDSFKEHLKESKFKVEARAGWNGNYDNIEKLLATLYDDNVLSSAEKKKKDTVFRQYYRYYNDGDQPKLGKRTSWTSSKEEVAIALELYVLEFMSGLLKKYTKKNPEYFITHNGKEVLKTAKKFKLI